MFKHMHFTFIILTCFHTLFTFTYYVLQSCISCSSIMTKHNAPFSYYSYTLLHTFLSHTSNSHTYAYCNQHASYLPASITVLHSHNDQTYIFFIHIIFIACLPFILIFSFMLHKHIMNASQALPISFHIYIRHTYISSIYHVYLVIHHMFMHYLA